MSDDVESKPGKVPAKMEPAPQITFEIDPKKHVQFSKILKKLDRDVEAMLDYVKSVAQDEEATRDVRLKAATYFVDKAIDLKREVAKEVLTRQIAQVKMLQAMQPQRKIKDVEEDDEDDKPTAIFSPQHILSVPNTTHM